MNESTTIRNQQRAVKVRASVVRADLSYEDTTFVIWTRHFDKLRYCGGAAYRRAFRELNVQIGDSVTIHSIEAVV